MSGALLMVIMRLMVDNGRYTRGRMAKCYHKACDVWDPDSRSPESPRFLATVTQAVLESVLEMAEEEIIQKDMIDETVAEKEVMNENAVKEDVIKEDTSERDVVMEDKEKVTEETAVQTVLSKDEAMSSARESEVVAVPRKAFSRDILSQQ